MEGIVYLLVAIVSTILFIVIMVLYAVQLVANELITTNSKKVVSIDVEKLPVASCILMVHPLLLKWLMSRSIFCPSRRT